MFSKMIPSILKLASALFASFLMMKSLSLIAVNERVLWFDVVTVSDWPQATWYLVAAIGVVLLTDSYKKK